MMVRVSKIEGSDNSRGSSISSNEFLKPKEIDNPDEGTGKSKNKSYRGDDFTSASRQGSKQFATSSRQLKDLDASIGPTTEGTMNGSRPTSTIRKNPGSAKKRNTKKSAHFFGSNVIAPIGNTPADLKTAFTQ